LGIKKAASEGAAKGVAVLVRYYRMLRLMELA